MRTQLIASSVGQDCGETPARSVSGGNVLKLYEMRHRSRRLMHFSG